jgi:hypothetical protein
MLPLAERSKLFGVGSGKSSGGVWMPVNDWPTDVNPGDRATQDVAAARAAMAEAKWLLGELHDGANELGDALAAAGFSPRAWRSDDARLAELGDQLPDVTVDALFSRLAEFTADSGPAWLAGDGEALDDFEHEVLVLAGVMRPLRVVAQRQRLTPPSRRGRLPLERALGDGRVGAQLDRLVRTLRLLVELAPQLEPVPPEPDFAAGAPLGAGADVSLARHGDPTMPMGGGLPTTDEAAGHHSGIGGKALGAAFQGRMARLWAGVGAVRRVWAGLPRRTRLAAVAALLVIGVSVSGVLALHGITQPRTSAPGTKTVVASRTATAGHAQVTPGRTTTTAATTPAPAPGKLAINPTSIRLCPGTSGTLTISNTGGQALTWQARAPQTVILSATSGSLGAHTSATITVRVSGTQHGPGSIVFTAGGSNVTVTYRVSCR